MKDAGEPVPQTSAFNQEQFETIYPVGVEKHYWNLARNQIVLAVLRKHSASGMRVLDLGCGPGITVDFLREQGVECTGIDAARAPRQAQDKEYLTFSTHAADLAPEKRRDVEVVLLLDVIEHLELPERLLENLQTRFPNMTTLLVTVPARPEIWSPHDVYNGHYRRYDAKTLYRLLANSGYDVVEQGYFFHLLYIPARMMSLIGIDRKAGFTAPRGRLEVAIHRALAQYFFLESRSLPKALWGSSLLAVARVPKKQ